MGTLKWLVCALALLGFGFAKASVMCAGETYDGDLVSVEVDTIGTMGVVQKGIVTVGLAPLPGTMYAYSILPEEIPQFFEDTERAVVGLSAFVGTQGPVFIRYVGPNYRTESYEELIQILQDPNRQRVAGNRMIVWKGLDAPYDSVFSFRDVVCSVFLNP